MEIDYFEFRDIYAFAINCVIDARERIERTIKEEFEKFKEECNTSLYAADDEGAQDAIHLIGNAGFAALQKIYDVLSEATNEAIDTIQMQFRDNADGIDDDSEDF